MGIFLSDDSACTFDLIYMVNVTDCPPSLICISVSTSAALSPLTEPFHVLVNPVEKDTRNSLSRSLSNGLFSSDHSRASSTAFICVLARSLYGVEHSVFPDVLLHPLFDVREVTEGEHSALVARITVSHSPSAQSSF